MEIRSIAVIGAGAPGRNIAQLSALGGFRTILEDILPASLRQAESEMHASLRRAVEAGRLAHAAAHAAMERMEYATSIEQAARAADLVIEAVPEELESKSEIFILLDKLARPATILASSTSSFSITELAAVTYRAKKILGLRFFLPGGKAELLEIVRARETDDETVAACAAAGRRMGREIVVREEARAAALE